MADRPNLSLMAFMAMSFAIVGLTGIFATYAVPLPLERALARETALDDAAEAARGPDPAAALAALAPRLDDSAAVLAGDAAGIESRITAARETSRAAFQAEAAIVAVRVRVMIGIVTLMGAVFGVILLGARSRQT